MRKIKTNFKEANLLEYSEAVRKGEIVKREGMTKEKRMRLIGEKKLRC